jgi:uncharacterized SAM-binding protein YcdF (DUF218 family)
LKTVSLTQSKGKPLLARAGRILLWICISLAAYCAAAIATWHIMFSANAEDFRALKYGKGKEAAIAIFYSDDQADRSQRVQAGLETVQTYPRAWVYLLGGARPSRNFFGSQDMARSLRQSGVNPELLRTERTSHDTRSNVAELIRMANADSVSAVVLISDPFHLVRIRHEIARTKAGFTLVDRAVGRDASSVHILWRSVYEMLAWATLALPEGARQYLLTAVGRN